MTFFAQLSVIERFKETCRLIFGAGVAWLEIKYEGAHGKGTITQIAPLTAAYDPLPLLAGELEQVVQDAVPLMLPDGWMTDVGSHGTLIMHAGALKAHLTHTDNREGTWSKDFGL